MFLKKKKIIIYFFGVSFRQQKLVENGGVGFVLFYLFVLILIFEIFFIIALGGC